SAAPISARFSTVGFTAASGVDFTARTNVAISFPSMTRSKLVTISVANDNIAEQDEAFLVTLGNVIGASLADGTGVGTINNDDT
ncbi:MAG: Calx-beta domain-containing protein, partial [Acidimicrobiia bacterium]